MIAELIKEKILNGEKLSSKEVETIVYTLKDAIDWPSYKRDGIFIKKEIIIESKKDQRLIDQIVKVNDRFFTLRVTVPNYEGTRIGRGIFPEQIACEVRRIEKYEKNITELKTVSYEPNN
jgi:hypothetical protein